MSDFFILFLYFLLGVHSCAGKLIDQGSAAHQVKPELKPQLHTDRRATRLVASRRDRERIKSNKKKKKRKNQPPTYPAKLP